MPGTDIAADDSFVSGPAFQEPVHSAYRINPRQQRAASLRVIITERLANRLISKNRLDSGVVNDCILGAHVVGCQTTQSSLTIDFRPSATTGHIDARLNGLTHSDTIGTTPQARVANIGEHSFVLTKPVYFDGTRVLTRRPGVQVHARSRNVSVRTMYSGFPLVGLIADQQALLAAEQSRPLAESIAGRKLAARVAPEFNRSMDKRLARLNRQLQGAVREWLQRSELLPQSQTVSTTDTALIYSATTGNSSSSIGGRRERVLRIGANDMATSRVEIHESLLNDLVERLHAGGAELTDRRLFRFAARVADAVPGLRALPPLIDDDGSDDAQFVTVRFDSDDPVRFEVLDGYMALVLRVGFRTTDDQTIPTLHVRIPFRGRIEGKSLVVETGRVRIAAADANDESEELSDLISGFQRRLGKLRNRMTLDRSVRLPLRPDSDLRLRISDVSTRDGWLLIGLD